ncbi:hypothetical protein [Bacillus toyonensis]|uniref:hypothetical protein n=1 Tax=Bacillus toyonensis TaxID=155322 RepID=UPI0036F406B1
MNAQVRKAENLLEGIKMKRVILDIQVGGTLDLNTYNIEGKDIKRIWSVFDEQMMWDSCKFNPLTGKPVERLEDLHLKHREGVFIEDYVHDYKILKGNILHYYTRIAQKGEQMKILIELKG